MKTWANMFFDSRLEKTCPEKTQKDRASPAFSGLQCAEFCHLSVETLELLSLVLDVLLLHSVASNASLLILPCSKRFLHGGLLGLLHSAVEATIQIGVVHSVGELLVFQLDPMLVQYGPSVAKPNVNEPPSVLTPYVSVYSWSAPSTTQF